VRAVAILAAAVTLAACAGPSAVYYRDGVRIDPSEPDAYECLRDATALGGSVYIGFGFTQRTVDWNIYHMCMRSRGWRLVQE